MGGGSTPPLGGGESLLVLWASNAEGGGSLAKTKANRSIQEKTQGEEREKNLERKWRTIGPAFKRLDETQWSLDKREPLKKLEEGEPNRSSRESVWP